MLSEKQKSFVIEKGFKRIMLQFPNSMVAQSSYILEKIKSELSILSETQFFMAIDK